MGPFLTYMHKHYPWLTFEEVLITIFQSVFIAVIFKSIWNKRKMYSSSLQLPGPMSVPILGTPSVMRRIFNLENPLQIINDLCKKYQSPFQLWLGRTYCVVLTDPVDIEQFYSENYLTLKPKLYCFLSKGLGNGMFTGRGGEMWKKHKLLLNTAFNFTTRKNYENILNKQSIKLVEIFRIYESFDYELICRRFCADIMSETILNQTDDKFETGDLDELLNGISKIYTRCYKRFSKFHLFCDWMYKRTHSFVEVKKYRALLQNHFLEVFNKKKVEYWNKKKQGLMKNEIQHPINELIVAHKDRGYAEDEIIDQIINIFSSGTESIFSTLSFFILMLGMHQECQETLYNEINDYFSQENITDMKIEDLYKLSYLDKCFKEVLRLFPVSPFIFKEANEDATLSNKNITIPSGTIIAISTFFNNRNEAYWTNPNVFDPNRFSTEAMLKKNIYEFLPYSIGGRSCLGQHIAPDFVKFPIVHLVKNYKFHSDHRMEDLQLSCNVFTMRPIHGYKISISRRS